VAEILVDLEQLAEILGLLERDFQLVVGKGLEHVIEGAVAHAFDGGFDGTEAGDHDDEGPLGARLKLAQEVGAFAIGQADVHEDEVERVLGEDFMGAGDGAGGGDVIAALAQLVFEVFPDDGVVFENDDFFQGHGRDL